MSSPHHHHHHHHCNSHHYYSSCCSSSSSYCSSAASCCCCCRCCNSSSPPPSLPPPPSNTTAAATDPLLHALANHLLLLQSPKPSPPPPPPPPPPPLYSYPHLKAYPSPQTHQPPSHDHHHQQQLLHSLLRRISALESSLPHLSPPPHPPPLHAHSKRSPSPKKHLFSPPPPPPKTLQDLAARTIQTHFRLFLVRRSQTLRHLKRLASIKSHVAALRSSLSDKTHLHPAALSESAMALLLELDAIQGGDPMIREGKRSISRELTRILDFVDKVLVKEKELMEIAENAYEVIPPTRTGKKLSFFEKEKGKRSPVSSASHEPFSENRDLSRRSRRDSGENGIDGSHRQLNSDDDDDGGEEEEEEEENSSESNSESSKAKLGLSAPLPLQMEPRRLTQMEPRRLTASR